MSKARRLNFTLHQRSQLVVTSMVTGILVKLWMFVLRVSDSGRAFDVAFATQDRNSNALDNDLTGRQGTEA